MRKAVIVSLTLVLSLSGLFWPGQFGRDRVHAQEQQPPPQLDRIGPDTITAGSPTFTLRLQGRRFAEGAKVEFDGVQLDSSRVSSKGKLLLADIDQSLIATPGTHTVRAVNPDGMASASQTLTVVEKDPDLTIRLEGNAAQEDIGLDFIIEVSGEGFNEDSEAFIYGRRSPNTEFISKTRLAIQIPANLTNDPGRIPILIRNRGGRFSNADIFFIVPRPVRIQSVEPETLTVGSEDVELKIRGNEFKSDARILVNDTPLPTTSPKKGQLVATIPASFLATPGILTIAVEQDGIQSIDDFIVV
ncbi:MAG TPA: IPT/TIG domain-containing protein, partial [Blastocatellia bacterium]|nr:IPT/TIG domain-containing protein [Blastocatellia bacterium]